MLRFMLKELPVVSSATTPPSTLAYSDTLTTIKIPMPSNTPELRQIIVPVKMLFDVFNRKHDGHLTRAEIG
jgi:hypothetical protein